VSEEARQHLIIAVVVRWDVTLLAKRIKNAKHHGLRETVTYSAYALGKEKREREKGKEKKQCGSVLRLFLHSIVQTQGGCKRETWLVLGNAWYQ
jgi:hypothetical protein